MENYDDDNISSISQSVSVIVGMLSVIAAICYIMSSLPEDMREYPKIVGILSVIGCAFISLIIGFLMCFISLAITNISFVSRKIKRIKDRMSNIFNNTYKFK